MPTYVTEKMVRDFLWDRTLEDNPLELDLAFSAEEIREAMEGAARAFNSIPPYSCAADPRQLPAHNEIFLHGIARFLYMGRLQKMMRSDLEYTAGGVTTSVEQKQIAHMRELIERFGAEFRTQASDWKRSVNIAAAFGCY